MTVATSLNRKEYNGTGSQTTFSFPYKVFTVDDVDVFVNSVLKVRGTHYNVTLLGSPPGVNGCDIVFTAGNEPPVGTLNVVLLRDIPQTQEKGFPVAGAFPSTEVEQGFDRAVILVQDLQEEVNRAMRLDPSVPSTTSPVVPAPVLGGESFRWKADKTAIELVTITGGLLSVITTRGDLIRGGASGITERVALGAANKFLKSDGTDALWGDVDRIIVTGPTTLTFGSVSDGQLFRRSGTTIVGEPLEFLRSGLRGLGLSNSSGDPTNDIDIAAGEAWSNDAVHENRRLMVLASALTKQLDAAWAVGNNAGMRDTGSIADGWWHIFLIKRTDTGVVDVLASVSATAPTMPTNYDKKKWIGAIHRSAGAIVGFSQYHDEFLRTTPINDVNVTDPGTAAVLRALTVPTGLKVIAITSCNIFTGDAATIQPILVVTSPDQADVVPSATIYTCRTAASSSSGEDDSDSAVVSLRTDTSGQLRTRVNASSAQVSLNIVLFGWYVNRAEVM